MAAKVWSLKDEIFSLQRGYQIKEFEVNGKKGRFMVMDPTTNDLQWWKSEILRANPSKARKEGIWTVPSDVIPEIIIRCCFFPYDYGRVPEEETLGADSSLGGQPVFSPFDTQTIGNSTFPAFAEIADMWIKRFNELYPIKAEEDAGN